ncbi:permease [Rummeliibacillus suwonensis]|uniref:permease n=1 Tax=Rummeliibacillus suwonensis TaxID=1306154 RepID=UPI001AAF95F7|nr:permease [Rummeliibacillus suwonensis]MBO2536869.1 permease [Rummeliibacillus suwonensis]
MFAGHFGIAAAAKGKANRLPLWSLIVSSQLLDIVFLLLFLMGIEGFGATIEGGKGTVIRAEYSHSLLNAILLSVVAGYLASRRWGKNSGIVIGSVTFSHWILDLIVHVPDLPILPGNIGNFQYLGFGLWQYPFISMLLEGLIVLVGAIIYIRYVYKNSERKWSRKGLLNISLVAAFLTLSFVFSV